MYFSVKQQEALIIKSNWFEDLGLMEKGRLYRQFANERRVIQKLKNTGRF